MRQEILTHYTRKMPLGSDVSVAALAARPTGCVLRTVLCL